MSLSLELFNVTQIYFKQSKIKSFVISLPCVDSNLIDLKVIFCNLLSSINRQKKVKHINIDKHKHVDALLEIFTRANDPDYVGLMVIYGIQSMSNIDDITTLDNSYFYRNENINTNTINKITEGTKLVDIKPIALGLVEMLDQEEHCLKLIWVDDHLDNFDPNLSRIITLRTIAYAFDYIYPKPPSTRSRSANGNSSRNIQKHISFLETYGKLFPKSVYTFLTDISSESSLKFGMHYETAEDGGSHEDYASTSIQCKCYKFAEKSNSFMFWGISESRLKNLWVLNRAKILPTTTPSDQVIKLSYDISIRHVALVTELKMDK